MSSLESHMRRLAKGLLVEWFRNAAEKGDGDWWYCCGVSARPNRTGPYWGVFEEYPVCDFQAEGCPVWDEEDWWQTFEAKTGQRLDGVVGRGSSDEQEPLHRVHLPRPPSRTELLTIGMPPVAILDIAVQHKGNIKFGIEIKHKHAVPESKAKFLDRCAFPVFEVKAQWIMSQVGIPQWLVVDRVFGRMNDHYTYDFWSDAA